MTGRVYLVVTLEQYAGPYLAHRDFTLERRSAAISFLGAVNAGLRMAQDDGLVLEINPATGSLISGSGNGGFRPQDCPIGASRSSHKRAIGIDLKEIIGRELARWSLRNRDRLRACGIQAMERPQWTPTWVHWQGDPVASGNFAFVPDNSPAKAPPLPEEVPPWG